MTDSRQNQREEIPKVRPRGTYCNGNPELKMPECDNRLTSKWAGGDLCIKHPRLDGFGFVRYDEWDRLAPYLFCRDVNGGACPLYEPKREGKDDGKSE